MKARLVKPETLQPSSSPASSAAPGFTTAGIFPQGKIKDLPSRGIGYDKKHITYRSLSLAEVINLNSATMDMESLTELYQHAVTNMDFKELSYNDALFVCMYILVSTSAVYEWRFMGNCPNCKTEFFRTVSVAELDFQEVSAPELPVNVKTASGDVISFDIYRVKHYLQYIGLDFKKYSPEVALYALLAQRPEEPFDEAYNRIIAVDSNDINYLRKAVKTLDHSIKPIKHLCTGTIQEKDENGTVVEKPCGKAFDIPVNLDFLTMVPKFLDTALDENRISFGDLR